MTKSRLISLILAAVAAMLVAFAGKACAEDIVETNQKNAPLKNTAYTDDNNKGSEDFPAMSYGTNPPTTTLDPYEGVETVTNILGEVIATIPATVSDTTTTAPATEATQKNTSILDRPDTTEATEFVTDPDHPLLGAIPETTTVPPTEPKTLPSNIVIQIG
ncbi:MAG: hypothetical protein IJO99_03110 [Ruminococcus sp.]|nr:hypothetical protein [Ruminococcus sp.]